VRAGVAVVLLAAGCAHLDDVAFGTAATLTACDGAGTYSAAESGWSDSRETNSLLGRQPSDGIVTLYFAAALTAELIVYKRLPKRYSIPALAVIAAIEADSALFNVDATGVCGL
jgi:hypothetical protein